MTLTIEHSKELPILHVDATPDKFLPVRILKAHLANCEMRWADTSTGTDTTNPTLGFLNDIQDKRAKILRIAISILNDEIDKADSAFE